MEGHLKNKVALITGGGGGLGAEFAKRFIAEGAKVVITDIRKEMLDKVAAGLPKGSVFAIVGDVSKQEDTEKIVAATIKFGGKIDVLVNNAGIHPAGTVVDIPVGQWQKIIDINLTGPFLLMKAAIPGMIKNGGGSIINIASLAAVRAIPAMPGYISSKAGLIGLTLSVALDYGPSKIRCNVICPGAIATEMLQNSMAGVAKAMKADVNAALMALTKFTPLRRPATPDEVSGMVVYLASDDSAFVTGAVMMIDGGAAIIDPNGAAIGSLGLNWGNG